MNFKGQEIIAEVSLEAETPPQKIGTLSCRSKALCWDEGWKTKFFKRSEELTEEVLHLYQNIAVLPRIIPSRDLSLIFLSP